EYSVLSNRRLDLHEFRGRQWLSFCFEFPKTIRDALRAFHAAVIVAAHLRASLIHAADVVSLAACCFDLLERVAAFWNREVVFCLPAFHFVIDLQPVEFHPMNLIASFVIDLAAPEGHGHTALAADETQLGFSLRGQSLFHSVYLFEGAIKTTRVYLIRFNA